METKEIEQFTSKVNFDSSYLSCSQGILNILTIRVLIATEKIEYRFYDVMEYFQSYSRREESKLLEIVSDDWLSRIDYDESYLMSNVPKSEYKHYQFDIDGYRFEILSAGFIRENGYTEVYREQKLVKEIIN